MSVLRRIGRSVTTPESRRAISRTIFRTRSAFTAPNGSIPLAFRTALGRAAGRKPNLYQLEVHVSDRCNLNCRGCGHFSPLADGTMPLLDTYRTDLARLRDLFASVDELWLLGGEPLLHPRFPEFVTASRQAFPDARIGIVSNGLLVKRQDESFWKLLRENDVHLRLSGYPIEVDYDSLLELAVAHGVSADLTPFRDEFYKMPLHEAGDLNASRMLAECRQHFDCPYLECGRIYHCARIPQSRYLTQSLGARLASGEPFGMDLATARDGWEVLRYLRRPNEWCRHCDAEHLERFAWGRSSREAGEWLAIAERETRDAG